VLIPPSFLAFATRGDGWASWLDGLPRLSAGLLADWSLTVDGEAATGQCAVVFPVRTEAGERAVLKVQWPHWEAEHEPAALRAWAGDGAVRLLRADPSRSAMLLERARTTDLTAVPAVDACVVVAMLYERLHIPATAQFKPLTDVAAGWARDLTALPTRAPIPRRLIQQAASLARDFASDAATDGTLIHSDLHFFNVLESERVDASDRWLVIDPKPLSGEPAHEVAPLLWNRWDELLATHDVRSAVRERFHTVVDVAGLDEDRARDWVIVRMVANAMSAVQECLDLEAGRGLALDDESREWITECISIAKAVQD
jgi:streptomycin 6-kinase